MNTSETQQILEKLFKDGTHMSKAIPAYPGDLLNYPSFVSLYYLCKNIICGTKVENDFQLRTRTEQYPARRLAAARWRNKLINATKTP